MFGFGIKDPEGMILLLAFKDNDANPEGLTLEFGFGAFPDTI